MVRAIPLPRIRDEELEVLAREFLTRYTLEGQWLTLA